MPKVILTTPETCSAEDLDLLKKYLHSLDLLKKYLHSEDSEEDMLDIEILEQVDIRQVIEQCRKTAKDYELREEYQRQHFQDLATFDTIRKKYSEGDVSYYIHSRRMFRKTINGIKKEAEAIVTEEVRNKYLSWPTSLKALFLKLLK